MSLINFLLKCVVDSINVTHWYKHMNGYEAGLGPDLIAPFLCNLSNSLVRGTVTSCASETCSTGTANPWERREWSSAGGLEGSSDCTTPDTFPRVTSLCKTGRETHRE